MFGRLLKNRAVKNASWIIVCKAVQAVMGLIISMLSARHLGPDNYGLLNYAISLSLFVTPVAQLGYTSILVHDLIQEPEKEAEIMGSAILSSLVSSLMCMAGIALFVRVSSPNETLTLLVCVLYSLVLLMQCGELLQYWFQAKLLSKYSALITLAAYGAMSVYQVILLILKKGVAFFAAAKAFEYLIAAVGLLITFRRLSGKRLSFSWPRAKRLMRHGWFYMLSALTVMTFAQADRIMLKMMMGHLAMGYYSAAVVCANLTDFIFVAIIDSFRPVILEKRLISRRDYENGMSGLYGIVIYLALLQSIVIAVLARPIIYILYGSAYGNAVNALRIIIWYTAFSYIGMTRNVWILGEKKEKLLLVINLCGATVNVGLNALLIPRHGIEGVAFASLVTQMFTNWILGYILPPIRDNNRLIMRGLDPRIIIGFLKQNH